MRDAPTGGDSLGGGVLSSPATANDGDFVIVRENGITAAEWKAARCVQFRSVTGYGPRAQHRAGDGSRCRPLERNEAMLVCPASTILPGVSMMPEVTGIGERHRRPAVAVTPPRNAGLTSSVYEGNKRKDRRGERLRRGRRECMLVAIWILLHDETCLPCRYCPAGRWPAWRVGRRPDRRGRTSCSS